MDTSQPVVKRKRGRPKKAKPQTATEKALCPPKDFIPTNDTGKLWHQINNLVRQYLAEQGTMLPEADKQDVLTTHSLAQLNEMYGDYIEVVAVLEDITRYYKTRTQDCRTVLTAKTGLITNGKGFKLNYAYLRYLLINGQGEADIV